MTLVVIGACVIAWVLLIVMIAKSERRKVVSVGETGEVARMTLELGRPVMVTEISEGRWMAETMPECLTGEGATAVEAVAKLREILRAGGG